MFFKEPIFPTPAPPIRPTLLDFSPKHLPACDKLGAFLVYFVVSVSTRTSALRGQSFSFVSPEPGTVPGTEHLLCIYLNKWIKLRPREGQWWALGYTGSAEAASVSRPSAPSTHLLSPLFTFMGLLGFARTGGVGAWVPEAGESAVGGRRTAPPLGPAQGKQQVGVCVQSVHPSRGPRLPACPSPSHS